MASSSVELGGGGGVGGGGGPGTGAPGGENISPHHLLHHYSHQPPPPHPHHHIGGSLGAGRRSRTPLTDLDTKFVAKSGLCVSGDTGDGRAGTARITHLTGVGVVSGGGGGTATVGASGGVDDGSTRFPRLDQCAHFHYEYVELPPIQVVLVSEELKPLSQGGATGEDAENRSLLVQVTSLGRSWVVRRTYENFRLLDRQLHRCCYDRKYSHLPELPQEENLPGDDREAAVQGLLNEYVARLSEVAGSLITCGPVLNWLELDNRGHRLIVTDDSDINTPAVAAAYVVKRYTAQASDEISFEVGDMISVIDMPPPDESIWWRGKRGFQVGFFPCECVQVIGDKVPQAIHPQALTLPAARGHATNPPPPPAHALTHAHTLHGGQQAPTKPVLRKHGKLIAFFRSFILSRPSRRKLKQSGILRERVFGCDLGEHLLNSGHEIPMVLKCCAEFIESHGVVDGIYRLSGITSNIQKLRNAFDEDRIPELYGDEGILQDIHCVSSVLKMYFRELPNPLLTYQLYDKFVAAVMQEEDIRLLYVRDVVQQLPPPHYRTLEYLVQHLARVASNGQQTGMTPKNIAIVWAPNLLRSKDLDMGGVAALQDVGTQAVVTEYLVRYVDLIFNDKIPTFSHSTNGVDGTPRKSRPKSLAISTPTKLISIEEARVRALGNISSVKADQKYIEVGGGPNNLPPKYHTVIELPNRKGGSLKQKKSPLGWKSFFGKGRSVHKHQRKASTPSEINLNINDPMGSEADVAPSSSKRLRPVKSVESLVSTSASLHSNRNSQVLDSPERRATTAGDRDGTFEDEDEYRRGRSGGSSVGSSPLKSPQGDSDSSGPSPRTHSRSVSHDSYFNRAGEERSAPPAVQLAVSEEGESDLEFSPENSKIFLDISELNIDFNTSEKEMKIFSEDETLKSTSIEDADSMSRSMQDVENVSMGSSDVNRSRDNLSPRNDKRSLKDKLKRFTSPASQRRAELPSDSGDDLNTNSLKRASNTIRDKIAHALSPETSRRRADLPPFVASHRGSASPLGSPKLKHVRTTSSTAPSTGPSTGPSTAASSSSALDADDPLSLSSVSVDMKGEDPGGGGGGGEGGGSADEGGREETVTVEVHAGLDDEDARSRQSIESALIDPELMAKLTHMRSSPSVSNSEGGSSSVSMAEATVSDNESFTLGSGSAHGELGGAGGSEGSSLPPVSTLTTPSSPPVTLILGTPVEDQEVLTPQLHQEDSKSQSRPTSLLGIPTSDLLTCALASPETPQGDSTFLEIQYHPLSDTTEPSTPSESQFVQDLVAVHPVLPAPKDQEDHPRQSSPLSPDISSDEPTDEQDVGEDGPLYENVEASSTLTPIIASQPSSLTPSLPQDDEFEDERALSITPQPRYTRSGFSQDSPEGEVTYENVEYGAEYENVPGGITPTVTVVPPMGRGDFGQRPEGSGVFPDGYEDVVTPEGVTLVHTNEEPSDGEPKAVYENVDDEGRVPEKDTAIREGHGDLDHPYEDYSFGPEHEYENVEFPSTAPASGQQQQPQQGTSAQQPQAPGSRTETEVEGEIVYQQVKFLKRSIQEVNELLRDSSSDPPSSLESSPLEDSESILSDDSTPLAEDKPPLQSPSTAAPKSLPKVEESEPITVEISYPDEGAEGGEAVPDEDAEAAGAADDSECLDSPVSPSTASLPTEVMVLPSFSSPTESTTDDVTSPPSSESLASPHKGVPSSLPQPLSSPTSVPTLLPQLSPSPDPQPRPQQQQEPQQGAASSTTVGRSKLSSILAPAPWPRTAPRHTPIAAPVAKPRQLPYVSPLSPLLSPDDTSASPDTPTTPVEDEEVPIGISLIGNTQDLNQVLQPMPQLPQPPTASQPQPTTTTTTTTTRTVPPDGADAEVPSSPKPVSDPIPIPLSRTSSTRSGDSRDPASASPPARPPLPMQLTSLQRYKTSPDMRTGISRAESEPPLSTTAGEESSRTGGARSETEDPRTSAERPYIGSLDPSDPEKRERIERYKEERRTFLREKYKSESFRGEKDEMLLRLKQKATSPSRPEEEESLPLECPGSPKRRVLGSTPPSRNLEEPHGGSDLVADRPKLPEETNGETRTEVTAEEVKDVPKKKTSVPDLPLKRTSPTRRSLSDMGRAGGTGGELAKSPGKVRSSSDTPTVAPPVFRRSASTDVTSPRTNLRKVPDKEPVARKHSAGFKPGTGRGSASSKGSPVKSPPDSTFRRSSSTHGGAPGGGGARRTSAKDDSEDDLNVKERAALWTQRREKSPAKESPRSPDKTGHLKLERKASHDSSLRRETSASSSSGIPISPTRKSSLPKPVVARQSSNSSVASSSASSSYEGHGGSSSSPAVASPTTPGSSGGANLRSVNVSGAAVAQQQRRIRDMAAIFERDSATTGAGAPAAKPVLLRQASREDKRDR